MHGVIQIGAVDDVTVEQTTLAPSDLTRALLVDEQPGSERLGLDVEEAGELLKVHGSVELEVASHRGRPHVVADLVHEDGDVVVDRIDIDLGVVKVGRGRVDELGARGPEQLLEDGQALGAAALHARELLAVLLAQRHVDRVVEPGRVEGDADGHERVHLIVVLLDRVVLRVLLEVLGARHVHENVREHPDRVRVPAHHHVREADVVVRRKVRRHDPREHSLLVQLDVVQRLERQAKVPQQRVHA